MLVKKKIIVSVTNDLVTDQRVHKVCTYLFDNNFEVLLVGRKLKNSPEVKRTYKTKRFRLLFTKGFLFYANYNIRLFFFLLFKSSDVLLSNDLDTLLPNYLVSKIKRQKLVYDTHEYFTEVPELINRPIVKKIWEKLESWIFPKLKHVYTVNQSLADMFSKKYNVEVFAVKNVPNYIKHLTQEKNEKFTVFYQGALNVDRGLEELILAFQYINEDIHLEIAGTGDIDDSLKNLVKENNLCEKIKFLGRIPFDELSSFTRKTHLGVSLEKGTNLNYRFSLPNKLFDYISANIPVLTCELREIKNIVTTYKIGKTIKDVEPKFIAEEIISIYEDGATQNQWIENTKIAAAELCWEKEITVLDKIYL